MTHTLALALAATVRMVPKIDLLVKEIVFFSVYPASTIQYFIEQQHDRSFLVVVCNKKIDRISVRFFLFCFLGLDPLLDDTRDPKDSFLHIGFRLPFCLP